MKISKTLKGILSTVSPLIGNAVGGPVGGAAVKILAEKLTGDENTSLDELEKIVASASPEQLAQMKDAEYEFKAKLKELGIEEQEVRAKDRASARDMQKANKSKIVPLLATITVGAFFAVVAWVLSGKVTLESTLLGFVLGQVSAKAEQVYNFYFGSSDGSKRKTEKLNEVRKET